MQKIMIPSGPTILLEVMVENICSHLVQLLRWIPRCRPSIVWVSFSPATWTLDVEERQLYCEPLMEEQASHLLISEA